MNNAVSRCYELLRLLRGQQPNTSLAAILKLLGVDHKDLAMLTRARALLIEEITEAEAIIDEMNLGEDARDGLLQTTEALKRFIISEPGTQMQSHLNAIHAAAGGFAILVGAMRLQTPPRPAEVADLEAQIDEAMAAFSDPEIDPRIRKTATRHLQVLKIVLAHIEAFGVDAALEAYSELVVRLQRACGEVDGEKAEKAAGPMARVRKMLGTLKTLNEAYDTANTAIEHVGEVAGALGLG